MSDRQFVLLNLPKQSIGAEIGVHVGDFSSEILKTVHPKTLFLVDPWEFQAGAEYARAWYGAKHVQNQETMDARYNGVMQRFKKEIESEQVIVYRDYSANFLRQLPDDFLDWIYIDGNHLYEYTRLDLNLSIKKVKPGGLITGDEWDNKGWWDNGARKAVNEFLERKDVTLIFGKVNQYAIKKIG